MAILNELRAAEKASSASSQRPPLDASDFLEILPLYRKPSRSRLTLPGLRAARKSHLTLVIRSQNPKLCE